MDNQPGKSPVIIHLGWIIAILIGLNIATFTKQFGTNETVVSYVGFAGTIVSILLAFIAIIYSFYQNATNVGLNQRLTDSTEKIEAITSKIGETTQTFVDSTNEIKERFEAATSNLTDIVVSQNEATRTKIEEYGGSLNKNENTPQISKELATAIAAPVMFGILDSFVRSSSYTGVLSLYGFSLAAQKNKTVNIVDFATKIFPGQESYIYGYFVATSSMGLITFTGDMFNISISYFLETFADKLAQEAEKRNFSPNSKREKATIEKYFCAEL